MKKIIKTALIVGTAFCVTGALMFVCGFAAGGKNFTYKKNHVNISVGNDLTDKDLDVMKKQKIDSFTDLNVDFRNYDLDIRTSDDDSFYMEYKLEKTRGNRASLIWEDKNGTLTLKEAKGAGGSYFVNFDLSNLTDRSTEPEKQNEINTIILYIPQNIRLAQSSITLRDGDVTAEELAADQAELNLDSGDLYVKKGEFGQCVAELGDGDLYFDKLTADGIDFTADSGDIILKEAETDSAEFTLKDGNLNSSELTADKLNLNAGSGDVCIEELTLKNGDLTAGDGDMIFGESHITGTVNIENHCGDVSMGLDKTEAKDMNIQAEAKDGDIQSGDIHGGNTRQNSDDDSATFENKAEKKAPQLNINCYDGDITL